MKCNFIHIKLKNKSDINLNRNKILELFKLSAGNNIIDLYYNKNKKESSNKNIEINYYKKYTKKNVGKMIYLNLGTYRFVKILDKIFISKNFKRANIIINNKKYKLEQTWLIKKKKFYKIEIKFLDIIINLNSMFKDCDLLYGINNFQNLNTKYLKTIYDLFSGCDSLYFIDELSNWNLNNVNNISKLFYKCSSLKKLPDISKWNTSNITNISLLFFRCSSLKELPDISKWDISNVTNCDFLFSECIIRNFTRYL